jgi:hypothetical protein
LHLKDALAASFFFGAGHGSCGPLRLRIRWEAR